MKNTSIAPKSKYLVLVSVLYLIITVVTIAVRVVDNNDLENIFKPILMPILMLILFINSNKLSLSNTKLIFIALFFSMLGDVFLMPYFDNFILGLVNFLIAHIFYIVAFVKFNNGSFKNGLKKGKLIALSVFLAYLSLIALLSVSMLESNTEIFLIIAVVIYATIISVMVLTSISLYKNEENFSKILMMTGAMLFMLSDSIIAINKFVFEITLSGLWIMITYTLAQWLITIGVVKMKV